MNTPKTFEIVLLLLGLNMDKFEGKTNIHKNLYLLKEMISRKVHLPYNFRPYFYGPYSEEISNSLDLLENSKLITSEHISLGQDDVFEIRQTNYQLTEAGKSAYEKIRNDYLDFYKLIARQFEKIQATNHHQNTRIMSTAAKVRLILTMEKKPLNRSTIRQKAKQLGWEIGPTDVNKALDLLLQTNLARKK